MSTILVMGATGTVGQHLVSQLLANDHTVIAATRSGQQLPNNPNLSTVEINLTTPTSFENALNGVDSVFMMLPSGQIQIEEILLPLVKVAAEKNIKIVMQSVFGVDADDNIPYRKVEIALENSGTPYVILRPNWFADNFHTFWLPGVQSGVIALPAGEGASSFIDARDIAASAAAALTSSEFDNQAFNLTGPAALTYTQAAELISAQLGKPVQYQGVSDEAFIAGLVDAGVPQDYAEFLASIFYPVRENWTSAVTNDVATLTGTAPRSLATYLVDNKDKFIN